ncbi:MAG: DUF202 domain-containing protein [Candidatus Diapherotrites archaeon]
MEDYLKRKEEEEKLMSKNPVLLQILLSKEQTIESKLRTAFSLIQTAIGLAAFGLAIITFFKGELGYLIIGAFLILIALILVWFAIKRYFHYAQESQIIKEHRADLRELIGQE